MPEPACGKRKPQVNNWKIFSNTAEVVGHRGRSVIIAANAGGVTLLQVHLEARGHAKIFSTVEITSMSPIVGLKKRIASSA
jgi:hypothetical protein